MKAKLSDDQSGSVSNLGGIEGGLGGSPIPLKLKLQGFLDFQSKVEELTRHVDILYGKSLKKDLIFNAQVKLLILRIPVLSKV